MVNYLQRAFTLKSIAVNLSIMFFCYILVGADSVTRYVLAVAGVMAFYGIGCAHGWDAGLKYFFKQLETSREASITVTRKGAGKYEIHSE